MVKDSKEKGNQESTDFRVKKDPVTLENNAVYEGEWLNGQRDGEGKQKWEDGAFYEGQWKEGKASGTGKFNHADGDMYEGEWSED